MIDAPPVVSTRRAFLRDGNFLIGAVNRFGEFDRVKSLERRICLAGYRRLGVHSEREDLIRDILVNSAVRQGADGPSFCAEAKVLQPQLVNVILEAAEKLFVLIIDVPVKSTTSET